jgi:hypothetical protein
MSTIAALGTSAPLTGDAATAYDALTTRLRKLADLDAVEATLQWDELVMMPDGAAEARGRQKAALAELKHGEATSAEMGAAIAFGGNLRRGRGMRLARREHPRRAPRLRRRRARARVAQGQGS